MITHTISVRADHGIGPWLDFGDTEQQLRIVRPAVHRTTVPEVLLPFYALMANELGYCIEAGDAGTGIRLVLLKSAECSAKPGDLLDLAQPLPEVVVPA